MNMCPNKSKYIIQMSHDKGVGTSENCSKMLLISAKYKAPTPAQVAASFHVQTKQSNLKGLWDLLLVERVSWSVNRETISELPVKFHPHPTQAFQTLSEHTRFFIWQPHSAADTLCDINR